MTRRELSFAERADWLRLARTSGVGPVTFRELIGRFGTAGEALDALPRLASRGGKTKFTAVPREHAEAELDHHDRIGARLICACEPDFPRGLSALDPPPPVLSVMGPLDPDAQPACAIVGSRGASGVGLRFAGSLARDLGQRGVTVVSGLARGIDGAAHAGALETGTVAALAAGSPRSIRPSTPSFTPPSPDRACWSANPRPATAPPPATSPAATASFPACLWAWW